MTLDWLNIVAQILNFLVLLYLLKRFLYPPILRMMEKREELIASRVQAAEDKMKHASEAEASYLLERQELAAERDTLISQARDDAEKLRAELSEKARTEVEADRTHWLTTMRQQQAETLRQFRRSATEQVVSIARRALQDLADEQLEQRIVARFVERLQSASSPEATAIRTSFEKDGGSVSVVSTFALPDEAKQMIRDALHGLTGTDVQARFAISPELGSGIQLTAGDVRVAWSLQSYLDAFGQAVSKAVQEGK